MRVYGQAEAVSNGFRRLGVPAMYVDQTILTACATVWPKGIINAATRYLGGSDVGQRTGQECIDS